MRKNRHIIYLLIFVFICSTLIIARQYRPIGAVSNSSTKTLNVIFIGNSYTYAGNLEAVVAKLSSSAQSPVKLVTARITRGGATLESHYKNRNTINKLKKKKWDFVVLQEQSTRPLTDPKSFYYYAGKLSSLIKQNGAKPVYFMTWARQNIPQMTKPLADAYTRAGFDTDAFVAPVGLAWARSLNINRALPLHNTDKSHPNERGVYLTACVLYATLTGNSPVGLSDGGMTSLTDEEVLYLQKIALSAVQEYKSSFAALQP